jgi:hypothetical protein
MLKGYYMNYWKGRQKEKRDRTKNEKMMDDDDDDDSFTHTASPHPAKVASRIFKIQDNNK